MRSTSLSSASASCSIGRALDEHVDADAVANRHLVDEAPEVPLQLGDAPRELIPAHGSGRWAIATVGASPAVWARTAPFTAPLVGAAGATPSARRALFKPVHGPKKLPVNLPLW